MKKTNFYSLALLCLSIVLSACSSLNSQGCVAIRSTGSSCTSLFNHENNGDGWQLNATYRYYKSFRHFKGEVEQTERVEKQTDVRNYTNYFDLTILKNFNHRWSLGINLPFQSTERTSLYEHDGKTRHATSATGLGDIRVTVYGMVFEPNSRGNLQIGLGIKLPTGDYKYQDFFYKNDTTEVLAPVDQSIQLGDGGTGITAELNSYINIYKGIGAYGNFYYLSNPRNHNGVSTKRGGTPSATDIKYRSYVMSVADQYAVRAGINYLFSNLTVSAGIRAEGVPSADLLGENDGFRRPGYTIGFEPSLSYNWKSFDFYASVPIAMKRNRTQNDADKRKTADNNDGIIVIGDAAFADYSINVGMSFRFGGSKKHDMMSSVDMGSTDSSQK